MTKSLTLISLLFIILTVNAQNIDIPDAKFKYALLSGGVDTSGDKEIQLGEAQAVNDLQVSNYLIENLKGIEAFTNLVYLNCSHNYIANLDLSKNTALTRLDCYENDLTTLNIPNNTHLTRLWCYNNDINTMDVSKLPELKDLRCYMNQLTVLDVSKCTLLDTLECLQNNIRNLNVSQNPLLIEFDCSYNELIALDVHNNSSLLELRCGYNQIDSLDISNNKKLMILQCINNSLERLDIKTAPDLFFLDCQFNRLTKLNASDNNALITLWCSHNPYLKEICLNAVQFDIALKDDAHWHKDASAEWSTICAISSIEELNISSRSRQLVQIFNILGQEVIPSQILNGGVFIYYYKDGSIAKIVK
jgi:hypothetical protein